MLDIRNLYTDLGEFSLEGIDLHVNEDEYFVILGPTGAGKTILLETIAGIYPAEQGKIILRDKEITEIPPKDRPVNMVYQDYMLFPHLTVEENIRFGLEVEEFSEDVISKRVSKFVDLLDLENLLHRYSRTLSGGERQRVALARSLVMDPDLLLLDEPISALDVPSQERIMKELKEIHRETDVTILQVTHSREKAIRMGDRVGVMREGKIVQTGDSSEVFKKPDSEFIANFIGTDNIFEGNSKLDDGIAHVQLQNGGEIVSVSDKEGHVKACIRPEEIMISKTPIDSSGRNTMKGEIVNISERESTIQLDIDAGIEIAVKITKKSYSDMDLNKGDELYLSFKATAVHLI